MLTGMLGMISRMANKVLAEDAMLQAALQPFDQAVVAIDIQGIELTLYVCIINGHISIQTTSVTCASMTRVQAPPSVWLRVIRDYTQGRVVRMQGLRIEGDAALINQLLLVTKSLPIDWEALLASQVGDTPAMLGMRALYAIGGGIAFAKKTTGANVQDAIHDEWNLAPSPLAMAHFAEHVQTLRDDADRLAIRIDYLQKRGTACEE